MIEAEQEASLRRTKTIATKFITRAMDREQLLRNELKRLRAKLMVTQFRCSSTADSDITSLQQVSDDVPLSRAVTNNQLRGLVLQHMIDNRAAEIMRDTHITSVDAHHKARRQLKRTLSHSNVTTAVDDLLGEREFLGVFQLSKTGNKYGVAYSLRDHKLFRLSKYLKWRPLINVPKQYMDRVITMAKRYQ